MEIRTIFNSHKTWYGYCRYLARSLGRAKQFCGSCIINVDLITRLWCQQKLLLRRTSCTTRCQMHDPDQWRLLFPIYSGTVFSTSSGNDFATSFAYTVPKSSPSEFPALRIMWIKCSHLQCSEITLKSTVKLKLLKLLTLYDQLYFEVRKQPVITI